MLSYMVLVSCALGDSADPSAATSQSGSDAVKLIAHAQQPQANLVDADCSTIAEAYGKNPFAASERFRGRNAVVTGRITEISRRNGLPYVVTFGASGTCLFFFPTGAESSLMNLEVGQQVTLQGQIDGYEPYQGVHLVNSLVRTDLTADRFLGHWFGYMVYDGGVSKEAAVEIRVEQSGLEFTMELKSLYDAADLTVYKATYQRGAIVANGRPQDFYKGQVTTISINAGDGTVRWSSGAEEFIMKRKLIQ